MSKKIKVQAIQIAFTDGSTKNLSIEDARVLYQQLEELFGSQPVSIPTPIYIERDRYPHWINPSQPYYVGTDKPYVYCCTSE